MDADVRRVSYFYATVPDAPGEGYRLLSELAEREVNLLAFHATPLGPEYTRLSLFPENAVVLAAAADDLGLVLDGPHPTLLVQGEDQHGALVDLHRTLYEAGVNLYGSSGVTGGRGGYGFVLFIRPKEFERAAAALGV